MGLAIRFEQNAPDAVSLMLFTALLVPMTFIDLEFFAIPEQLNLLAFAVVIGRDIWGIARHEPNHAPLFGWLPRSVVGALAGILIFGGVRLVGWIWKRREAMGLGDVLLARAMGGMLVQLVPVGLPLLRLFPAWVLLSCLSGMIVGIPLLMVRGREEEQAAEEIVASKPAKQGKHSAQVELGDADPDEEPRQQHPVGIGQHAAHRQRSGRLIEARRDVIELALVRITALGLQSDLDHSTTRPVPSGMNSERG